jgi:pyridoxal 5'-phosphate synthase pdxT subunit
VGEIGVLDVQGDVSEHVRALRDALHSLKLRHRVSEVNTKKQIQKLSALVIPGGESTTISLLMQRFGLDDAVSEAASSIPIFGTCAGLILLCKTGDGMKKGQKTLSLLDAKVVRNAFGRQKESFEAEIDIPSISGGSYPAVFIRAPAIERVWGGCESLSNFRGKTVLARQKNILGCAFHPELTDDLRIHKYFLEMI